MNGCVSAPGKAILLGEHAVVYGKPAIAIPLSGLRAHAHFSAVDRPLTIIAEDLDRPPWRWTARAHDDADPLAAMAKHTCEQLRLNSPQGVIHLRSDIPIASGMGSGAAVSAALGSAIARLHGADMPDESLNELVYEVEKLHHGKPSGIDNTTVVYAQPVFFQRDAPLEILEPKDEWLFVLADTGVRALTRESVAAVAQRLRQQPDSTQRLFADIAQVASSARDCIEGGDREQLGAWMSRNHELLRELGVSSPQLDSLVTAALAAGACGAKLSGGGRGGNMIALVEPAALPAVESALERAGAARLYTTSLGGG